MFLPRTNSSTSLSSLSSFRTTDSQSRVHPLVLPGSTSSSIGWSTPTTASNTVNVSAQVHYSFLASQYRQQSAQRGLGIAEQGYGYGCGYSAQAARADRIARPHAAAPAAPAAPASPPKSRAKAATISPGSPTSKKDQQRDSKALRSLFAGARVDRGVSHANGNGHFAHASTSAHPRTALRDASAALDAHASATSAKGRRNAPHGARHGSLRDYAKERIKAQEHLENVIANATDTGRLKWEAKAALLSGSPSLALLLLIRAASLGSVSACISLSALYTTGVTRGVHPLVVLVHREPLSALAWILQGMRLLRRRRDKSRSNAAWAQQPTPFHARSARPAQSRKTQEKEALDQILKMIALLERLLRTVQAAADLSPRHDDGDGDDDDDVELLLPDLHRLQARGCRAGAAGITATSHRLPPSPSLDESLSWSASMQLWPSVLDARLWLEAELDLLFPSAGSGAQSGSYGPDDDDPGNVPAPIQTARLHLAAIKALHLSHSTCRMGVLDAKTLDNYKRVWDAFRSHLASQAAAKRDAEMPKVSEAAQHLIETLVAEPAVSQVRAAGADFWSRLDASLPEAAVPVLLKPSRASLAPSGLGKRQSFASLGAEDPLNDAKEPASPRKRIASSPAEARRKSLEDLPPLDVDVSRAIHQPALLRSTSSGTGRVPSTAAVDATASGTGVHFPIDPNASPKRLLTRTISHAEKGPALLSAPPRHPNGRNRAVSSIGPIAPSYSHHFGSTTITGAALNAAPERPSSVVSDSPSLLFGEDSAVAGLSSASPEQQQQQQQQQQQRGYPAGLTPRSPLAHMPPSQSHSGELFLGPRARAPSSSGSHRRPSMPSRQRVTSLYGTPSLNTSHVHTSGVSSSAYGHVGPAGVFDPTASLRENQYRRRRADSNASVATGISLFSTQAMMHDVDAAGQAPSLSPPPEGHAMATMINNGGGGVAGRYPFPTEHHRAGAGAADLLRGNLRPRLDSSASVRGRHVVASGPATAATAAAVGLSAGGESVPPPSNGATASSGTPLLTERLERNLAASYASQQRVASGGGGGGGWAGGATTAGTRQGGGGSTRRDDASISSRLSTTSRRTGLASLRTAAAAPVLGGILPKSTTSTSLAASPSNGSASQAAAAVLSQAFPTKGSGEDAAAARTRTMSSGGDARASAQSALGSLRAIRQRTISGAAPAASSEGVPDSDSGSHAQEGARFNAARKARHPTLPLQDVFLFPSVSATASATGSQAATMHTTVAAAPAVTAITSARRGSASREGGGGGAAGDAGQAAPRPRPDMPQRRSFFGVDPTSGGYGSGGCGTSPASPGPSPGPLSPSASQPSPTRSALKSPGAPPSTPSSPKLDSGDATSNRSSTHTSPSPRSVRFDVVSPASASASALAGRPSSSSSAASPPSPTSSSGEKDAASLPISNGGSDGGNNGGSNGGNNGGSNGGAPPASSPSPAPAPAPAPAPLDPALARAEDASRLHTAASCYGCGATCINAPLDRRGRKFCSRVCRVGVKARERGGAEGRGG